VPEALQAPSAELQRRPAGLPDWSVLFRHLSGGRAMEFLVAVNDVPSRRQQTPEYGAENH